MLTLDLSPANLGPSAEWIAAYKVATAPTPGMMSIAPSPELAWACEQILGSYSPDVVIPAIREAPEAYLRACELYADVVSAREQQKQS